MRSQILLILSSFLYFGCQASHVDVKTTSNNSTTTELRAVIDIDPFYNWGKHPTITLSASDTEQLKTIVESYSYKAPFPKRVSFSPPPPMSSIGLGKSGYHIMDDCRILGRKLDFESKLKIYKILSKYTSHFSKPKPSLTL